MSWQLLEGDCLDVLPTLEAGSVHTCVTSPPYWGLRDYGVDGQLGLEPTPAEYLANMVAVFREVRRVLRDDGTLWLNLGDSYNSSPSNQHGNGVRAPYRVEAKRQARSVPGLKPKDLCGIPWRVAFALQDDGWYLRQDIIWHKPNPMPESVRDRCTKAHEYLFLLSKRPRYYFDADAISEESIDPESIVGRRPRHTRKDGGVQAVPGAVASARGGFLNGAANDAGRQYLTRNKRSVWTIPSKPYPGAHFATFPPALIEPCILAGCAKGGTVLDPFAGSGTTLAVAERMHCDSIGIELSAEYAQLARQRLQQPFLWR